MGQGPVADAVGHASFAAIGEKGERRIRPLPFRPSCWSIILPVREDLHVTDVQLRVFWTTGSHDLSPPGPSLLAGGGRRPVPAQLPARSRNWKNAAARQRNSQLSRRGDVAKWGTFGLVTRSTEETKECAVGRKHLSRVTTCPHPAAPIRLLVPIRLLRRAWPRSVRYAAAGVDRWHSAGALARVWPGSARERTPSRSRDWFGSAWREGNSRFFTRSAAVARRFRTQSCPRAGLGRGAF